MGMDARMERVTEMTLCRCPRLERYGLPFAPRSGDGSCVIHSATPRYFTHVRPSTSKTMVQILTSLELPEATRHEDRLTLKASTTELWNAPGGLASFDVFSINQQYRTVTNSLTRIAYGVNKLKLVTFHPTDLRPQSFVWIDI